MAAPREVSFIIGVRDRTRRVLRRVGRALSEVGRRAVAMGARVAAVATAAFALLSRNALTTARGLKDVASQLGISTDFLQAFQNAVREGGASVESSNTFLQRFITNLGKARDNSITFIQAFEKAGIRGKDLLKPPLEVLDQLLTSVKNLDQASRQAIVSPIADTEGVKAVNALLANQLDTVQKIVQFGGTFGIIPERTIDRLDAISTKFRQAFQAIKPAIFSQIADVLEKLVPLLPGLLSALVGFAKSSQTFIGRIFKSLGRIRENLGGATVNPQGVNRSFEARRAQIKAGALEAQILEAANLQLDELRTIKTNTRAGASYGP